METVRRLYGGIRKGADYDRSLHLLDRIKSMHKEVVTKSSLMLGLGETVDEVLTALMDLRRVDCDCIAFGQYLQPGLDQVPVVEYLPPERFSLLRREAYRMGFRGVTAGPLVRSSYRENGLEDHGARYPRGALT
jgi:lipoic acid synthetase